ncbi:hypothetical protein K503DRAFT_623621 [Rhizopogon vinicolor AM-OR11-026]|uniref:Uncharacterized protein n=1 Tax=Rhizopogon vinicolor AM-OR11-026 TaxID=1314800 RepID=A0A1B7MI68_9AGAM|nr:hypothetical protein K503DRAFT_623621 [Rhizopogon vinicolor AM-OR11-026]
MQDLGWEKDHSTKRKLLCMWRCIATESDMDFNILAPVLLTFSGFTLADLLRVNASIAHGSSFFTSLSRVIFVPFMIFNDTLEFPDTKELDVSDMRVHIELRSKPERAKILGKIGFTSKMSKFISTHRENPDLLSSCSTNLGGVFAQLQAASSVP